MRISAVVLVLCVCQSSVFAAPSYNVIEIGTLGGSKSYAWDINDSGQVVGSSLTSSGQSHAFLYENGGMTDLGTLGGIGSIAEAINNSGQVAGRSLNSSGEWRAFL